MGIIGQDFEGHEVAHIFTDTHPSTTTFLAGGGKWAVVVVILHGFIEREVKQLTDAICGARDHA
jgi:hypothetical protein